MIRIFGTPAGAVEVHGCAKGDGVFDAYDPDAGGMLLWAGDLVGDDEQELRVHGVHDGTWAFGVGQTDEDNPLPTWMIRTVPHTGDPDGGPGEDAPIAGAVQLEVYTPVKVRLVNVRSAGRRTPRVRR